ncbi:hypothetical protein LXD69_16865 [Flavobacterium sediminilitoris]|uniref:Uncharacterized protein n=1 Tax=Flavobacterium sediminilitoris TaxID=2024526 RepID=A0ABY4HMY1_9FLAO|nr:MULTISPECIES: hypothetical protein [Flavobacterium]UOX33692.1 hypothetical protein LXD69_16865 [Flavobacterium sediminilitoris]
MLILFSNKCISQSFSELKKTDTVYIYFKNDSEFEKRYKSIGGESKFYENHLFYSFVLDSVSTIIFTYNDYMNSDDYEKGIKTDFKIFKKSFLRRNKDIILDIDFFLKNGFKETYMNALHGKIIYLIDSSEIKNRKIKIKQVKVISNYLEL